MLEIPPLLQAALIPPLNLSHLTSQIDMTQTFGDYEELPFGEEYLIIGFSPSSVPLKQRWRNNGLSADFLADYLTTFFPGSADEPTSIERQGETKGAISYIANELLENAMKFNDETTHYPISIRMQLESNRIIFQIANSISPHAVGKFQAFIKELTTADVGELYIQQLEKNASDEESSSSGLGLLTMIHDYMAKIGWKFETVQAEQPIMTVTTMVQLTI